ncbi:alpha/beta fold hydrolase [Paraflavitalea sp. CAU 1676]|uniref:S9 family peptidase n=1 Tax=Paraflavitalea sp. CAU 1676 TaxID=3032598 RepID=UPI0023DCC082|nr:alpha/beta fold hydrolase [Paraflavitalea sp. CAU 1676]MDF2187494.1 alpha/beta fold hydrolase [Paraflavitalea sp. CAU 1676]
MKRHLLVVAVAGCLAACNDEQAADKAPAARQVAQYSIEQFYKSTNVGGGSISTDDKKLLVSSNESGIYNAYEIDIATGDKKALTTSAKESIFGNDYVPGSNNFIYSSDKGGNENDHLFLQKTDGSIKDLTPGAKEKAGFYGWSRDNKAFYYNSNKRDPRFFDLYKMDTGTWKPHMIYKNDNGFDVGALSDNERYLALVQTITTSSTNLYLADQQTKQTKLLNRDSIPSSNSPLQFSMDNNTLYYLTDEGSEYQYVVKYDIPTGNKEKLYSTNWDVMYMYLSYNEKYRVIGVNEDGKNKLYIFDHKTGKAVDFPKLDDGDVQSVNISRSENKMRLTVGNSKSPNNIYIYDFGTKELKKLTNTLAPDIKEEDLVPAEIVRYKSFDGLEIPAIYYKPQQASADNKVPALVWVHGGPGGQSRAGYFSLIQYLVNHGYAILAVNNRGSSGYGKTFFKMDNRNHGEKDLQDCVWGKKHLASLPYIDSTKIGIIGGSYGGYMTLAALCFQPDEFKAGVDLFGVANWLRTLKEVPPYWESFKKALYEEIGDPNTADTLRLKQFSPLLHAGNIKKPLMVLQGANDPRVLKIESDEVVEAVKKNNVPVEYVVFPDEGHGFVKKENEIKGYGQILQFLDKHLKGDTAKTKLN